MAISALTMVCNAQEDSLDAEWQGIKWLNPLVCTDFQENIFIRFSAFATAEAVVVAVFFFIIIIITTAFLLLMLLTTAIIKEEQPPKQPFRFKQVQLVYGQQNRINNNNNNSSAEKKSKKPNNLEFL